MSVSSGGRQSVSDTVGTVVRGNGPRRSRSTDEQVQTTRKYTVNGMTFTDMYGYTRPGLTKKKRLRLSKTFVEPYPYPASTASRDLDAAWDYDSEGKVVSVTYPTAMLDGWPPSMGGGETYTNGYDAMGRPVSMGALVTNVTYGPAGELLTMTGLVNETRAYNSRLQLTQWNGTSYGYAAGQNNGRIQSEAASGDTISYQYDVLNRLIKAETVDQSGWGQQFTYDGFGNLTAKSVTRLHGVGMSVTVDRHTNRISDYSYDTNGNQTATLAQTLGYDFENRLSVTANLGANTGSGYGYDPDNRRMYTVDWDGTTYSNEMVHFYGVDGQRMGSYRVVADAGGAPYYQASMTLVLDGERVYFAGRLTQTVQADGYGGYNVTTVQQDRLGSVGSHYPYGEERGAAGMFATYTRDAGGLDYALNRYYSSGLGRFTSPDPYVASGGAGDPGSWNRYGYVSGDPVNSYDPLGLFSVTIAGQTWEGTDPGQCKQWVISLFQNPWLAPNMGSGGIAAAQNGCMAAAQALATATASTPPAPLLTCTIDFEYRGISGEDAALRFGAGHGYLHVTTPTADYVVEGVWGNDGSLQVQETDHGILNDAPGHDRSAGSITGTFVCNWLSLLDTAAAHINAAHVTYDWYWGPNSNTALAYLLDSLPPTLTAWWHNPGLRGFYPYSF